MPKFQGKEEFVKICQNLKLDKLKGELNDIKCDKILKGAADLLTLNSKRWTSDEDIWLTGNNFNQNQMYQTGPGGFSGRDGATSSLGRKSNYFLRTRNSFNINRGYHKSRHSASGNYDNKSMGFMTNKKVSNTKKGMSMTGEFDKKTENFKIDIFNFADVGNIDLVDKIEKYKKLNMYKREKRPKTKEELARLGLTNLHDDKRKALFQKNREALEKFKQIAIDKKLAKEAKIRKKRLEEENQR